MLKSLLLLGWFRVRPFLQYAIIFIIIVPAVGISVNSSVAKQSQLKLGKMSAGLKESDVESPQVEVAKKQDQQTNKINPFQVEPFSPVKVKKSTNKEAQPLVNNINNSNKVNSKINEEVEDKFEQSNQQVSNNSTIVKNEKIANIPVKDKTVDLIQKLRDAKVQSVENQEHSLKTNSTKDTELITAFNTATVIPPKTPAVVEIPVEEQPQQPETVQNDPMGSPHPIPWQWILKTQATIGGNGGSGVRHYRSIPVVSPDGRYAVYSRVQLEVQPEMHNSRVSSLLFLEDRETNRLQVMSKTAAINDPLLNKTVQTSANDQAGKIGVLVPISWSKTGDRFLARKFVGIFNTADVTDQAVVWDRQQNLTTTVAPDRKEHEHEKIAILLGWSQKQPDHVLFRAGELGEEEWPLVQVSIDGTGVNITTEDDQPVTFGERDNTIWSDPQVAFK
jgi:hypothetical protein